MRKIAKLLFVVVLAAAVVVPAQAMSVEELIAKHIEAKGGKATWDKIKTVKVTGSFTAFSKIAPFTLHRKRDRMYHMDHTQNGRTVIVGYDGTEVWWDNHWFQPGAQPIDEGPNLNAVMREVEFATPFFDYETRGFEVKLIGDTEIEGMPAIGIELKRPDETVDTWYLHPESYLELGLESPGSDFGRPMPTRTFFDDFRKVGGVMIPHLVESQWYTRDRVMNVDSVELNVEIDDKIFRMPPPPGMEPLLALPGKWTTKVANRPQPGADWEESERKSEVEKKMRGSMLQGSFTTQQGNDYFWTLSYDRFQKRYRYTQIDTSRGQLDVREGDFDEEGRLVLSNVETGTTWEGFGMTFNARITFFDIGEQGFKTHTEISTDGGENWFLAAKQEYAHGTEEE